MHPLLQDVVDKCSGLNMLETRHVTGDSCDLIFPAASREPLNVLFADVFGEPAKPTGESPTMCQALITKRYGGVRQYQKLYMKKDETARATVIAMVRPWKYGKYFTVKLAVLSDTEVEKGGRTPGSALRAWLLRLSRCQ